LALPKRLDRSPNVRRSGCPWFVAGRVGEVAGFVGAIVAAVGENGRSRPPPDLGWQGVGVWIIAERLHPLDQRMPMLWRKRP